MPTRKPADEPRRARPVRDRPAMNPSPRMGIAAALLAGQLTRNGGTEVELVHDATGWSTYTYVDTATGRGWYHLARMDTVVSDMLTHGWLEKADRPPASGPGQRYVLNEAGLAAFANLTRTETLKSVGRGTNR